MKKTYLILIFVCCLAMVACSDSEAFPVQEDDYSSSETVTTETKITWLEVPGLVEEHEGLRIVEAPEGLRIVLENVSATGLTYYLVNDTNIEFGFGTPFELFVKRDGNWVIADLNGYLGYIGFRGAGFTLFPYSQSYSADINFEPSFGTLPAGEYKFVKKDIGFMEDIDYNFEERRRFMLSYEFTIE
ncbi:MAG: hypothetical protein FWF76_04125 [Oscillospiraceae bacterium]|nr:hypothetical protein [Oscillospiraceae bacterium]